MHDSSQTQQISSDFKCIIPLTTPHSVKQGFHHPDIANGEAEAYTV